MTHQNAKPEKPSLRVHEWLAITLFLGFLGMLTAVSIIRSTPSLTIETDTPAPIFKPSLYVIVEGAVEKPGRHKLEKGSLVKDALALAIPLPNADTSKINIEAKLRKGQTIHLPKIEMITIYLQGAVDNPGPLRIPKNTRLDALTDFIYLPEYVDLKPLQKSRRLKDNQIIHVKQKKNT